MYLQRPQQDMLWPRRERVCVRDNGSVTRTRPIPRPPLTWSSVLALRHTLTTPPNALAAHQRGAAGVARGTRVMRVDGCCWRDYGNTSKAC